MSKIDLSKAKIGDKFRTRDGHIMVYTSYDGYILGSGRGEFVLTTEEEFPIGDGWEKLSLYYFSDGTGNDGLPFDASNVLQSLQEKIPIRVPYGYELVEQVFDKPLDTIERDIRINYEMGKVVEVAKEEKQELQRRQEVVELAEKLVTNELFAVTNHIHDMRELGAAINLDSPTEYAFLIAEEFVSTKEKYLKEGKL